MSTKLSRKRKASLRARAEQMNEANARRRLAISETIESTIEGPSTSLVLETAEANSLLEDLPAPTGIEAEFSDDEADACDEDYMERLTSEDTAAIYSDWLSEMKRTDKQKVAVMLYDNYVERMGLQKTDAAKEVGIFLGVSDKTVRLWRKDFLCNDGKFSEDNRGKYTRYQVMFDEEYRDIALEWVRTNCSIKGKPNMVASDFSEWVNSNLLPIVREHHPNIPGNISARTAQRWLHKLGFDPSSTRKGVYIDGHERSDVVEYRKLYLKRLEVISLTHAPPPFCEDEQPIEPFIGPQLRNVVLLFHDESTFHSNEDQGWMWAEKGKQPIRPKGIGRGIMVSDFVDEFNGLLTLTAEEFERGKLMYPDLKKKARVLLKYGVESEGYWNSEKFIKQVEDVIKIVNVKYPRNYYNVFWFFDHSSGHTAFAEDALNVNRMNVKPGGAQPRMRDTYYNGRLQKMVFSDSDRTPKGMKKVLEERGVNVSKMKAEDMRQALQSMNDFKYEKTKVENLLLDSGYKAYFIPKFHCELNPIERVWAQSKKYSRANCDYSFKGLENIVEPALESVSLDSIRKFFRKMRDYLRAYREEITIGPLMDAALKKYKSHRKIHEDDS